MVEALPLTFPKGEDGVRNNMSWNEGLSNVSIKVQGIYYIKFWVEFDLFKRKSKNILTLFWIPDPVRAEKMRRNSALMWGPETVCLPSQFSSPILSTSATFRETFLIRITNPLYTGWNGPSPHFWFKSTAMWIVSWISHEFSWEFELIPFSGMFLSQIVPARV